MQIQALKNKLTGEIIYSRARHDYREFSDGSGGFVDGGFDYFRCGAKSWDNVEMIVIELDVDAGELFDDWDKNINKYGVIPSGTEVNIVEEDKVMDFNSFERRKECLVWGTYGPKGDQPRKNIALINAETSHLQAILSTQSHISDDTRKIIESILEDRNESPS